MPGFDAYLISLEARISALEEIALVGALPLDEARQARAEAGTVDLDQVQQLVASPYLPWDIEGGTP